MNHTRIAAEALHYRMTTVRHPLTGVGEDALESMAAQTVAAGDPVVDTAIRRIATAWIDAGLEPHRLGEPWRGDDIAQLFEGHPHLVDALDDLVRSATRSMVA